MEKIASFKVDHTTLMRGVYVSRKDKIGQETVTTFDIRMTEPNREPAIDPAVMHTIEHLAATFIRNDARWKDLLLYWGPMGCCTGFYMIVKGDMEPCDVMDILKRTFAFIKDYDGEIPGATPDSCGNYLFHDLPQAKREAGIYLSYLQLAIYTVS
ncbi:MAG: S-ribosylhomocysteine lyase [Bacteroidales bacterium]|jgi:S-ribosylhomocysteine lyase|nr:S-ribosylhomocysteine lyase [Bacteroidales bacterium]